MRYFLHHKESVHIFTAAGRTKMRGELYSLIFGKFGGLQMLGK